MTLGKKLKQLRQGKGWSLAELAKHSGVALSSLSRIETGKMTGTLESHTHIARALGIRLTELYAGLESTGPSAEMHRAQENRTPILEKGATLRILTQQALQKKMLPLEIRLPARKSTPREQAGEETEKFVHLLKGRLEVTVGEQRFRLKPGDSVYFQAGLPHQFINIGPGPVLALCLVAPPAL